jgi:hypothetical protein
MPSRDPRSRTPHGAGGDPRRQTQAAGARSDPGRLAHQERRRQRSIARARDAASPQRKVELRRASIIAVGAVAAMAVVATAFHLVPAIDAASGGGASGTFAVSYQTCSVRVGCTWVGTFQAASGEVIPDVAYNGSLPAGAGPGSNVPARYTGAGQAYAVHGSHLWVMDVLLMIVAGGAVAFLLWLSPLGVRKR